MRVTDKNAFFEGLDPRELVRVYGSPLYVYNEALLRQRCRELMNLTDYPNYGVNYSAKANGNLHLLKVVREEGLSVDAMSPGEIYAEQLAGFTPDRIFFISNNVSEEEMIYAVERDITISVDSVSQLEQLGRLNRGGKVAVRFNPGVGAGHHEKVVTGGKNTKFGVNPEYIPQVKEILKRYSLRLVGINQHIGSLFMEDTPYLEAFRSVTAIAGHFDDLDFIDIGGGFGIPYRKYAGEARLDMKNLGEKLSALMNDFARDYGKQIRFKIEPGRYISAECGVLLGTVHAVKNNGSEKYAGTDLGFNVLARPIIYDAYHEIEIFSAQKVVSEYEPVTVVGNICETGDVIAKNRVLPRISERDVLCVLDAGAYGYAMSSNYNNRLRPAEVFIVGGKPVLTRKRDSLDSLVSNFII